MKTLAVLAAALPLIMGMAESPEGAAADPASALGPTLAHVRAQAAGAGEKIWPGYGAAPFEFLLTLPDRELLLCRTEPTGDAGFKPDGSDPATGCGRQVRPRSGLPGNLLAAMPLFGLPPTIVMGTPDSTGYKPPAWTRVMYHEHFHQYQWSRPGYLDKLTALDLSGGDKTGMWILNYAFPYDRPEVIAAFDAASAALADAVEVRGRPEFAARLGAYLAARATFEKTVSAADWRYFDFQLWQEGVARWTEIAVSAADPDAEVAASSARLEKATLAALRHQDLTARRREVVYAYGAGEAMLLEACVGPAWRKTYFDQLAMGPLLLAARVGCGKEG
jgi:hypothetical protein